MNPGLSRLSERQLSEDQPSEHHLSEEEVDDLLIGAGTAAHQEHAAACTACAARLDAFRATVGHFNTASMAWSEAKSNTISRVLPVRAPAPRLGVAAGWSFVAALPVALIIGLALGWNHNAGQTGSSTDNSNRASAAEREQEIAGDNAMLQAIHAELYRPDPSPVQVYRMKQVDRSGAGTAPREVLN